MTPEDTDLAFGRGKGVISEVFLAAEGSVRVGGALPTESRSDCSRRGLLPD
jgi:hypothetical protein